jgi:Putative peptidoglycan binding domain
VAEYIVQRGDDIMSIAAENGLLWDTIWNHPDNAQFKQLRKDPGILFQGDIVVIPDRTPRSENAPTDQNNKFVKRTVLVQVRLRLLDYKRRARGGVKFVATLDGVVTKGQSDGDGYITLTAQPTAKKLILKVTEGKRSQEYNLPLGYIDPIDEISGVQQRLVNLGYHCGSEEGTLGDLTRIAVGAFQKAMNLDVNSELDDIIRQKLQEIHGS